MAYEPGTTECRVLINSKEAIETMLLNLDRLEGTQAIKEQLRLVHQQLEVLHDRRRVKARYLGLDQDRGLAFLRVASMTGTGLTPVEFQLGERPEVAEEVIAVGRLPRSHNYATTFMLARVSLAMYAICGNASAITGMRIRDGPSVPVQLAGNQLSVTANTSTIAGATTNIGTEIPIMAIPETNRSRIESRAWPPRWPSLPSSLSRRSCS